MRCARDRVVMSALISLLSNTGLGAGFLAAAAAEDGAFGGALFGAFGAPAAWLTLPGVTPAFCAALFWAAWFLLCLALMQREDPRPEAEEQPLMGTPRPGMTPRP